jgi:chemotaxis protein methyltransferase CheR
MTPTTLTDSEFVRFQQFIHAAAGITLSGSKKALVAGRLAKRVAHHGLGSFSSYLELLSGKGAGAEVQIAVDLLTTNETYFFRESKHFDLLRDLAIAARDRRRPMRVWSAACSSGEEVYSIAMVLDEVLGGSSGPGWELLGSDISSRVLQRARGGHYPVERTRHIPAHYLKRYCLRGTGDQEGTLLVDRGLRQRVQFEQINLNEPLPRRAGFDMIFLRNVMIYFNADTKRQVVARLLEQLNPGGVFCIGHSETLHDISTAVVQVAPSVYRKP